MLPSRGQRRADGAAKLARCVAWPRGRVGAERCAGRFSCAALISRPHRGVLRVPQVPSIRGSSMPASKLSCDAPTKPPPLCVTNRHNLQHTPTRRVHVQAAGDVQRLGELMTASQLVARKAAPSDGRATAAPCASDEALLAASANLPPSPPHPSHMLNFPRFGLSVQEAQMLFDRYATPICPSQAALPRTPSVVRTNGTAPDT